MKAMREFSRLFCARYRMDGKWMEAGSKPADVILMAKTAESAFSGFGGNWNIIE
jgi:hypothetical protein